jgi:hypothetical protein
MCEIDASTPDKRTLRRDLNFQGPGSFRFAYIAEIRAIKCDVMVVRKRRCIRGLPAKVLEVASL